MRAREVFFVAVVALGCRREELVVAKEPAPCPSASVCVCPSATVAKTDAGDPSESPTYTCKLAMRVAAGSKVKVGRTEVPMVDHAISLSGREGQQFIVTVESASGRIELVQQVFMLTDGCIPDFIDPARMGVHVTK